MRGVRATEGFQAEVNQDAAVRQLVCTDPLWEIQSYFDGLGQQCEKKAWDVFAEQLCNPDMWFDPHNFKGWSHFGKCSCPEELAMRIAIYGDVKI